MIVTIAGYKGGVGKTTTAIHIATFLSRFGPVALADGDDNRSATLYRLMGGGTGLPFDVIPENSILKRVREYEHIVLDTAAHPSEAEMKELLEGCDLLILPTNPETMSLDAMRQTAEDLRKLSRGDSDVPFRVLLTMVPPPPNTDGAQARAFLESEGLPVMRAEVRRSTAFTLASAAGVPVRDARVREGGARHKGALNAWLDYDRVGGEVASLLGLEVNA